MKSSLLALSWALLSANCFAASRGSIAGAVSVGGGRSSGGVYANQSTLGQLAGAAANGASYSLTSGFQTINARAAGLQPGTNAPVISVIADQVIDEDTDSGLIPITISDPDTPLAQLAIGISSSNPLLIRPADMVFGGTGVNRTLQITPRPNQSGSAIVTITASDPQNHSTSVSFLVEVLPVNDPPMLLTVDQATTLEDTPTSELPVQVRDLESPAAELILTAHSDNPALVPADAFTFGGTDSNRWIRIQPAPDQYGQAVITVEVSDGDASSARTFPLTVLAVNDPPTLLPVSDVSIESGHSVMIALTVNDVDDDPSLLSVTAQSDNLALVPSSGLLLSGGGANRQLTITPALGQTGSAHVGLKVTDPHGAMASVTFQATVTPSNLPSQPIITKLTLIEGGRVSLRVIADAGVRLSLESTPYLGSGAVWQTEGLGAFGTGAEVEMQSDPSTTDARCYRIRAD